MSQPGEDEPARRPGTAPIVDRHRLDEAALARWLARHLPGYEGPLAVRQFEGGQSNPTYHLLAPSGEYVLRKQPPGKLLPSAHAIDREYRILQALAGSDVPVPRARTYCEDASILGTPFYVMDYCAGRIFTDPLLPGLAVAERAAIYDAMNAALARLHLFEWRGGVLADFGRAEHYFARQIARWGKQYDASRSDDVPAMDALRAWLETHIPDDDQATIAHGDFRIGNLIFDAAKPQVVAILDWELSTIGHPMSDLAFNCMTYHLPAGHPICAGFVGVDIDALGIPSEARYLDAYADRTGRDARTHWNFFMAFSLFRIAAIQQGVYARALQGNAASRIAHLFGESYRIVADAGRRLIE